jgi:hypothetical protein
MTTTAWILVGILILVVIAAFLYFRQQRSRMLRSRFGPEYEQAVHRYGSPTKAEDALLARQKRVERIPIHSLEPEERNRFAEQWREAQSQFVDDPSAAIDRADQLVCEVMHARGYPMADFEGRAEDLSVDHPSVIRNYRAAHAIASKRGRSETSTEDMRLALVFYRDLFDELLEVHGAERSNTR